MKTIFKYSLVASLLICFACEAFIASDPTPTMPKAPANVSVDGKLTEWGDSLAMYDSKSKLNYTIAHDDSNLYVVAYVSDRMLKRKIMAGGITISVNSEGKKHKVYSLTYPIPDKAAAFMNRGNEEKDDNDAPQRPSLIESTSIKVDGFKDVESDVITTSNTYGFKAAVNFDDKHNLVYETAIPLKMLAIKASKKKLNELAINIAINGIQKPTGEHREGGNGGGGIGGGGGMGGGGMGGGGGGMGGGGGGGRHGGGGGRGGNRGGGDQQQQDRSGMAEATDFWVNLAFASH